ncbi:hypothetical protein MATL_G00120420 [Megalops atlanticus]|uniref:TFIIS N-terminal domain-containing protein n=1 Tax=Megalops atlanticus TaxID=7932 RepID=A0A9D3T5P1_MEGAT|nr:hypothetical protein MATL_G00120420 [Megalops atlanticus]
MDGEEDEFFSGNHSDDGGGTPVQDENAPASDGEEEARSETQHSEEGASDGEGEARARQANGIGSASENEDAAGAGDSDSEKDGGRDSDSEQEAPKPADSDAEEDGAPKHRGSASESEEQPKPHRGHSDAGSGSENEAPKRRRQIESDEEEGEQEKDQGNWKGVMHSDSEEEGGPARPAGSDQEQESGKRQQLDDSDEEEDKPVKRKKAIVSDSEDEDDKEEKPVTKKSRALAENSDSDAVSDSPDKSLAAKLRELGSDSEEEEDRKKDEGGKKDEKNLFGSDSDSDDEEEKMIADIFGESGDEEEEEFTGFNQEDLEGEKSQSEASNKKAAAEESDSDDEMDRGGKDPNFMSDFDVMLARKKAQSGRRRRNRDGGTFISDADDVVSAMITKMTEAAEEDRTLNSQKKPALKKLTLLPTVVMHLKKQDLKETFIDSGVMTAIKEWISPLPDKSLPALKIREELLRILQELPSVSQETLKHSGIGRAVMFLYKHPKESRSNKDLALKLINEWSRPIFGLTSNYKGMTREERQQRDLDQQMPPRRRLSSGGQTPRRDLEKVLTGEEKALRPGDPGFCARARVPMPSNKDYVVRPKWNVDVETNRGPMKKGLSRVDKQMRRFADIRRLTKTGHAVKISVEGNRMPL